MAILEQVFRDVLRYTNHLQPRQWLIVCLVSILVGLYCLRGLSQKDH
jgi:hypothetical protein